jgi:hypothetical protein
MILDVLEQAGELLQLRDSPSYRDERLERRLVVEQFVAHFIRPERRLDVAFQLHPGHIRVVVVRQQASAPCRNVQRRLGRQGRGLAQQLPPRERARPDTRRLRHRWPPPLRRMVVKNPVAFARSASGSD